MLYAGPTLSTIVALVGATIVFCRGDIFARVRRVYPTMLGCTLCIGWWVGALGMLGLRQAAGEPFVWARIWECLLDGSSVGLLALCADAMLMRLLGDPHEDVDATDRETRP